MVGESIIFVVNPGSASKKYAVFKSGKKLADLHFEYVKNKVVGTIKFNGKTQIVSNEGADIKTVAQHILPILRQYNILGENDQVSAIGLRIVAPSQFFTKDVVITEKIERQLVDIQREAPLHISAVLAEIKQLKTHFKGVKIVGVSDSAFHVDKPDHAKYYGIDTKLADRIGVVRFGYHGIALASVVSQMKQADILMPKTIICHLGSGSSVTAIENGISIDTTMGFSPLEGLMMSTRSGTIGVAAALTIKKELGLTDNTLEQYLDRNCGLLGVSGTSDDIRQLLLSEEKGDKRAGLALDMYVYHIQQAIGQMAASMDGVNCLVFTGTVGERSYPMRQRITAGLGYLGFKIDKSANNKIYEPTVIANIADDSSKPIIVIKNDEAAEIAQRVEALLKTN